MCLAGQTHAVLHIPAIWMLSGPRWLGGEGSGRTTDEEPAQF